MPDDLAIPGLDEEDIGTLLNVRTFAQYKKMVEQILSKDCPFCNLDETLNKVLHQRGNWMVWRNPFPLAHTSDHFIIAPMHHLTHLADMTIHDWNNMSLLIDYVTNPNVGIGLDGGAVVTRFGDPRKNAGSVRHLHTNIIVPDGTGRVQATLAKHQEEIETKKKILCAFEKLRTGTLKSELSPLELYLVADRLE